MREGGEANLQRQICMYLYLSTFKHSHLPNKFVLHIHDTLGYLTEKTTMLSLDPTNDTATIPKDKQIWHESFGETKQDNVEAPLATAGINAMAKAQHLWFYEFLSKCFGGDFCKTKATWPTLKFNHVWHVNRCVDWVSYLAYVSLQAAEPVHTEDKPHLEWAESSSHRNMPVLENRGARDTDTVALLQQEFVVCRQW